MKECSLPSVRIGTSGYSYFWNQGSPSPFRWYVKQGFNSVEINATFYRFPASSWIETWQAAPKHFAFSIKVHRSITHYARLKGKSMELWKRFSKALAPLEEKIEFWLFQMPPNYKYGKEKIEEIKTFFERAGLMSNAVVEFRDPSWWKAVDDIENLGVIFCSVDAPGLPNTIVATNRTVYLRLHGTKEWYAYVYSDKELDEILAKMKKLKADKKAIYLNNDHGMLTNGLYLLKNARYLL